MRRTQALRLHLHWYTSFGPCEALVSYDGGDVYRVRVGYAAPLRFLSRQAMAGFLECLLSESGAFSYSLLPRAAGPLVGPRAAASEPAALLALLLLLRDARRG